MNTFAEQLKDARKQANLTQQAMSVRMDIAKRTIQDWETGKRTPYNASC